MLAVDKIEEIKHSNLISRTWNTQIFVYFKEESFVTTTNVELYQEF